MRLIDADKLKKDVLNLQDCYNGFSDTYDKACIIDVIDEQPTAQPEPQWIPCSERLPERIINGDTEIVQEFLVTIKERWPNEEWKYAIDIAWIPGHYIDDFWQTYNDWKEGQEVHVIAWMPLPEPYKGEQK